MSIQSHFEQMYAPIQKNPDDWDHRGILADWLEEQEDAVINCGSFAVRADVLAAGQRWQIEERRRPEKAYHSRFETSRNVPERSYDWWQEFSPDFGGNADACRIDSRISRLLPQSHRAQGGFDGCYEFPSQLEAEGRLALALQESEVAA